MSLTRFLRGSGSILLPVVLVINVMMVSSDVYTSMNRIKDMVRNERNILNDINKALPALPDLKDEFLRFYTQRLKSIETRNLTKEMERVAHPNGAYSIIREFARDYEHVRQKVADTNGEKANYYMSQIADQNDVAGARTSLLLLQEVYNLTTTDMVKGVYMRRPGPALNSTDAYLVGQTAFAEGRNRQSVEWLETAIQMRTAELEAQVGSNSKLIGQQQPSMGGILSLLGRALVKIGDMNRARQMYEEALPQDPTHGDVFELGKELQHRPAPFKRERSKDLDTFYRLCEQHSKLTGKFSDHRLRCRTRAMYVPYYRYNEEIVSNTPYVSLFYKIMSDYEADEVKRVSRKKLFRGGTIAPTGDIMTKARTSNICFLEDFESHVVKSVSERIAQLTGLDTATNPNGGYMYRGQSSAEPLQVVNYGIGGYYSIHMDPYEHLNKDTYHVMHYSGNRLATFLVYLTDVERGGSTAFPRAELVVPPSKGNAVFWYSFKPSGELDKLTMHAGCPVMIGEKWIVNKWILTYGNTFTRRCGLRKKDTQLDIEKDMMRGYKPKRAKKTKTSV